MKKNDVFSSAGYLIRRLQQEIRHQMDDILGEEGITPPQFATLVTLKANDNVSNAELARISFVTPQTMVRIIRNLEDAGLIKRSEDPQHGRILRIEITEKGENLIQHCQKKVQVVEQKTLCHFTDDETEVFKQLLQKSLQNYSGKND